MPLISGPTVQGDIPQDKRIQMFCRYLSCIGLQVRRQRDNKPNTYLVIHGLQNRTRRHS